MTTLKKTFFLFLPLTLCTLAVSAAPDAEQVGYVNYQFHALGPDDRIVVEAVDDPKVENVTCFISHAVIGGLKGAVGAVTDPSQVSVTCVKTGPIHVKKAVNEGPEGEVIFAQSQSWGFKHLNVSRILDSKRCMFVYVVWSTELISGSPYSVVTAIPIDHVKCSKE